MAAPIIFLPCPNCRGKLIVTPDLQSLRCYFCGRELVVERAGDDISLDLAVPAVLQDEELARKRAADELLLRGVMAQILAAESTLEEQRRRLKKLTLEQRELMDDLIIHALGAVGFVVLALATVARGITGQATPDEACVGIGLCLLLVLVFLGIALSSWSMVDDRRRQSDCLEKQRRALQVKLGELREKEAPIRRRLRANAA